MADGMENKLKEGLMADGMENKLKEGLMADGMENELKLWSGIIRWLWMFLVKDQLSLSKDTTLWIIIVKGYITQQ